MNKLENTILGQARVYLSAVLDYYTAQQTGADSELLENDYLGDHGALCALLNLLQLDDSGLSVEAISALRQIDAEHLAAVPSLGSESENRELPPMMLAVRWQDGSVGEVDARSLGLSTVAVTQEHP